MCTSNSVAGASAPGHADSGSAAPQQPRSSRRKYFILLVAVLTVVVLVGACVRYRTHLYYWLIASSTDAPRFKPIPTREMPDTDIPDNWALYRTGQLELRLPQSLLARRLPLPKEVDADVFDDGHHHIKVLHPVEQGELQSVLDTASAQYPGKSPLTGPRFLAACYALGSDDFRWSMSPEEVRWHMLCLALSPGLRPTRGGHAETLFTKELDQVVLFADGYARINWEVPGEAAGVLFIVYKSDTEHNRQWVRAVCRSLKWAPRRDTAAQSESESHD